MGRSVKREVTYLRPTPPYDFDLTAAYTTYFRGRYGAESYEDHVFRRLLDLGDRVCLASVRSLGTVDSPHLEIELTGPRLDETVVHQAGKLVAGLLGTDQDLAPFYGVILEDPSLAPWVDKLRGLHVPQTLSVYEALVFIILGQQISAQVARMMRTLLVRTHGLSLDVSGETYYTFPRPETLVTAGVEGLVRAKLGVRKARYIRSISKRVASGDLDLDRLRSLPEEGVIRVLTGLPGVGPWTVQWLMIRALGRTDGFPHTDLALRRILGQLLNGDVPLHPDEALAYSRHWSPFRSYVTTYLFAAARSGLLTE